MEAALTRGAAADGVSWGLRPDEEDDDADGAGQQGRAGPLDWRSYVDSGKQLTDRQTKLLDKIR